MNTIYDTEYKIDHIKKKCKNDVRWVLEYFPEYISYWHDFGEANPLNGGCDYSFLKYLDENGLKLKTESSLMKNFKPKELGVGHFLDFLDEINYWETL
jgi:hypothetical protein